MSRSTKSTAVGSRVALRSGSRSVLTLELIGRMGMNFQAEHIGVCDFSHKKSYGEGRNCPQNVPMQLITRNLPIMNLVELLSSDCDCSHKNSGLSSSAKGAGTSEEVTVCC